MELTEIIEQVANELEFHVRACFNVDHLLKNNWLCEQVERIFEGSLLAPVVRFSIFKHRVLTEKDPEDIKELYEMLYNFGISGAELIEFLETLKRVSDGH